jgi:hypothetical protein
MTVYKYEDSSVTVTVVKIGLMTAGLYSNFVFERFFLVHQSTRSPLFLKKKSDFYFVG